ncbi:hypothetical protein [Bordetella sp. LUAb4]|uniref:hypothetical protein n=1 Tax=Bordetella sp. LUAb4 TaxID=2843195 RepID=UPI001E2EE235|nr:hypothetical protein [Bordetella sp. LUAb4]
MNYLDFTDLTITAPAPPKDTPVLSAYDGDKQSAPANTDFTSAVVAKMAGSPSGSAMPNVTVTFTITSNNATFDYNATTTTVTEISSTSASSVTNGSGLATSPKILAGSAAGTVTITASASNATQKPNFNLTITAAAPGADIFYVEVDKGDLQDQILRTPYPITLTASVLDKNRQPVTTGSITFDVPGGDTAAGSFASSAPCPVVNGIATASSLTPFSIFSSSATSDYGTFRVRAYPTGVDPTNAPPSQVAIYTERTWLGATAKITLLHDGQTTSTGQAFGTRLQASVQDSFAKPVENLLLTFTIPSGATFDINDKPDLLVDVTASTARVLTNASGVATAPNIIAGSATGDVKVQVSTPVAATQTYTLHVQSGTLNPGDGDTYRIDVLTGSRLSMSKHGQASPQFKLTNTVTGRIVPNQPMQMDIGNTGGASVSFSRTDPTMQSTTATTNDSGIALVTVYSADAAGSATLLASYPGADSKTVIISVS